jgi:tRNA nucleotidyltransferase (CCA-adding enzyme)
VEQLLNSKEHTSATATTWMLYLAALLDLLPNRAVQETFRRLAFARRDADMLRLAHARSDRLIETLSRHGPRLRASRVDEVLSGLPDELLLFLLVKARSLKTKRQISAFMTEYRCIKPRLTGVDLKAMGLKPGPVFKTILSRLRVARLDGEVKTKEEERRLVRKLAGMKPEKKAG